MISAKILKILKLVEYKEGEDVRLSIDSSGAGDISTLSCKTIITFDGFDELIKELVLYLDIPSESYAVRLDNYLGRLGL